MDTRRPVLTDPAVLDSLAHPVRLDVLNHLMSAGPATASACARAVGDTPSNCSYHLRVLAHHGLVEPESSDDGRERPWRATITGFGTADPSSGDADARGAAAVLAASIQLDQRLLREYLSRRDQVPQAWRDADQYSTYTLRATPEQLRELVEALDRLIRPLLAPTRDKYPDRAELVNLALHAFPRLDT